MKHELPSRLTARRSCYISNALLEDADACTLTRGIGCDCVTARLLRRNCHLKAAYTGAWIMGLPARVAAQGTDGSGVSHPPHAVTRMPCAFEFGLLRRRKQECQ